ncbi:MAG TPA: secondary thiamine-phosphate synthase enzyme YjbQ [Bacillota bacterium]|jgi:secondary thiamine-phosphate synthase enzyme|nr:secondary thiamine-phosphate synthase enzyme YjbQ [Bacillota bacterium]HOL09088.1 secondary thiamine-phosphate synthase enzyme YjbQ [Bacillota bacterium]HPO98034.1 secondary thiamine-phosphate synthase enzyme YjbQ [Bacillota bacterium]
MWKTASLATKTRVEFVDVTALVNKEVVESKIKNGVCYVFIPHTTAAVTINENTDPDVLRDLTAGLERNAPKNGGYKHSEGNSDAHIKASLIGNTVVVPVINGRLGLGTWQGIYFCEFDGPRNRNLKIGVMGE